MFRSIWDEVNIPKRPTLKENRKTEVAVVGAGLSGILIAYYLKKQGKEVIVLEAERIGSGMTKNTTAKITSQHNLIYADLIEDFGKEKAREYATFNHRAIQEYQKLIEDLQIDCDFEQKDSYIYSIEETKQLQKEVDAARSLGIDASFTTKTALPFPVYGAVTFPNQAQFHPLKFIKHISKELEIYENSMVVKRKGDHILEVVVMDDKDTEKEKRVQVEADVIVYANHYPTEKVEGLYAARMYQERENVLVIKEPNGLPYGMYVAANNTGYSFRKYKDYILMAGGNHRPGLQVKENSIEIMEDAAKRFYKDCEICYHMANQDCITLDGVPFIGRFSKNSKNVYIATGFNKWGMSHGMVAALLLTDMICNGKDEEESIYCPSRFKYQASKEELKSHMATVISQFTLHRLEEQKESFDEIEAGHGAVVTKHGKKIAVYKDLDGEVHCFRARCPHLGCLLEWNQEELSWDCPCHGSRFTKDGELICGPAKDDMKQSM